MEGWTPPLELKTAGGRCRLCLGGFAYGDGDGLQEAADDLVMRLLTMALSFRSGFTPVTEVLPPDIRWLDFVFQVGEIAARGGDVRARIFGASGSD
jgi:hypothetical protein